MNSAPQDLQNAPETPASVQAFEALLRQRRAAPGFRKNDHVPHLIIDKALELAAQAPSGFNFQPWRFLVLESEEQRLKLKSAANNQAKIGEAPVVIVAVADREGWKSEIDEIIHQRAARTGQSDEDAAKAKQSAVVFINTIPRPVWLTRHVMISFTYLMLAFEALGYDTAPMEGFNPEAVRTNLELPDSVEVVALLAVGHSSEPGQVHPGRLPVEKIAYHEKFGTAWHREPRPAGNPAHPPGMQPTPGR